MVQVYCDLKQIAENGFGPVDPVQEFIDSLLPFAPDLLIIADTFVGNNGDPVNSAPDSSGNNNPMIAGLAGGATLVKPAVNGKNAYAFSGGPYLQCPLDGLTKMCSITVFSRTGANASARIATLLSGADQPDAGLTTPINQYLNANELRSYYNGAEQSIPGPIADTNFHSSASWLDGTNGHLIMDGVTATPSASVQAPLPGAYAAIGGRTGGFSLSGSIAFHARWATSPSDPDIAAFLAIVNTYYGL